MRHAVIPLYRLGLVVVFLMGYCTLYATPDYTVNTASRIRITQDTEVQRITIEELYSNLNHPWGIEWLTIPDSTESFMVVTERNGGVWILSLQSGTTKKVVGLPDNIYQYGQGGWFDILQSRSGEFYLSYAKLEGRKNTTAVVVLEFQEEDIRSNSDTVRVKNLRQIFEMQNMENSRLHFGGMLTLGMDNGKEVLYIGLGERGNRHLAQDKNNHHGTVVKISKQDNGTYASTIVSFGHRNPQGMYYDKIRNILYETEHGPKGGDEVNIIVQDNNYGWPVVSYGKEYATGAQVGEGTSKPGMTEPMYYWPVSPALSGLTAYYDTQFPRWRGNLLVGALKLNHIYRLELNAAGTKVTHIEQLLPERIGRVRAIETGPDGLVYFITDERNGKIFVIKPAS